MTTKSRAEFKTILRHSRGKDYCAVCVKEVEQWVPHHLSNAIKHIFLKFNFLDLFLACALSLKQTHPS